jgi:hypothetical protein
LHAESASVSARYEKTLRGALLLFAKAVASTPSRTISRRQAQRDADAEGRILNSSIFVR